MKKLYFFTLAMIIVSLFYSCKDNVGVNNPQQYMKVYMPRADDKPNPNTIHLADTTYAFPYNAYLGGPEPSGHDIHVTFGIDVAEVDSFNMKNGTNYKLMPKGSYTIGTENAIIPAGQRSTDSLTVKITPSESSGLNLFQTYLLPLAITKIEGSKGKISQKLGITNFIISVSYAPGKVPRKKVLSLGQNWGDILANGPDGVLYKRDTNKNMWVYKPNEDGIYSSPPTKFPGAPWNASGWFYYINNHTEFAINDDGYYGGFRFDVNQNNYFLIPSETVNPSDPFPDNFGFYYGDGWNVYFMLSVGDYMFFANKNNGDLLRMTMSDFLNKNPGTWHKINDLQNANNVVETGFDVYKQVLVLGDNLLAVKDDGTLWLYPVSKNGDLGDQKQIGSGWDKYVKLVTTGNNNDILALDSDGNIYRYKIMPDGFYPLR